MNSSVAKTVVIVFESGDTARNEKFLVSQNVVALSFTESIDDLCDSENAQSNSLRRTSAESMARIPGLHLSQGHREWEEMHTILNHRL